MLLQHLKDVGIIQVPAEMSLQRVKLVSLTQVPVGTSLRRLKLVGFIYVPVRRCKNVSNRSVLLTHQLRRDDVSAWSRAFKLVSKMGQFLLGTRQYVYRHLPWFSFIKVPVRTLLQHLKDIGIIQVLIVIFLRRVKLVSLTQVLIGTLLQCLKLVGFIYVPMRCRKDATNRPVSFTYQLVSTVRNISTYMRSK